MSYRQWSCLNEEMEQGSNHQRCWLPNPKRKSLFLKHQTCSHRTREAAKWALGQRTTLRRIGTVPYMNCTHPISKKPVTPQIIIKTSERSQATSIGTNMMQTSELRGCVDKMRRLKCLPGLALWASRSAWRPCMSSKKPSGTSKTCWSVFPSPNVRKPGRRGSERWRRSSCVSSVPSRLSQRRLSISHYDL